MELLLRRLCGAPLQKSLRHRTTTPGRKPQHQCIAHTSASSLGGLNPDLPPGLPEWPGLHRHGRSRFYHDIQRQSEYASQATVLAKLGACPSGGKACDPRLAVENPQAPIQAPFEFRRIACSSSLNDQHLPLQLRTTHQLRLQATYGDAIRFGRRNEFSKSPDRLRRARFSASSCFTWAVRRSSVARSAVKRLSAVCDSNWVCCDCSRNRSISARSCITSCREVGSKACNRRQTQKPTKRWLRSGPRQAPIPASAGATASHCEWPPWVR